MATKKKPTAVPAAAQGEAKDEKQKMLTVSDEDYCWRNPKSRTVTVRAYHWQQDYRIDWNKRCDPDRIVSVEKMEIPDTGGM